MVKGMSDTLAVVVAAIVILITALVIITIFSGSISPVGGIVEARSNCKIQAQTSCAAAGQLPETWNTPTHRVDQVTYPCSRLVACTRCDPVTRTTECTDIFTG